MLRRAAVVVAMMIALGAPAAAQSRVLLEGTLDGEFWVTDSNSNLLTRNAGRPMALARLQLWGAAELGRGLVFYAMGETGEGTGSDSYETELEMAGLRYTPTRALVFDAGKITGPIGAFAARRFSWRNPVIGEPDGYPTMYPYGAMVTATWRAVDARAATLASPAWHEGYTPRPSRAWRPAFALGISPIIGVRFGATYTWGPYLNDGLTPSQLAGQEWQSYHQRLLGAELSAAVGYFELHAEAAASEYDVPGRAEPVQGLTYYAEGKYTFTPRLYVATRFERNDYPFIRPVSPTAWVARRTDFHNEELAVGWRLAAGSLVKASYRQDDWNVNAGNQGFVRPGGRAFALQLSQRFDVIGLMERAAR